MQNYTAMELKDIYLKSQSHKIISLDKSREMISHAYLIECADKFLLNQYAMLMVKELYCENKDFPCDNCISCQKIDHGNMVDLKCYPKDKSFVVDDILEIVVDVIQRPIDMDFKVYILNNFDCATVQAQNKILKTLEEPPKNVVFILTCSNTNLVLQTILSRVKRINEPLCDISTASEYLKSQNIKNAESIAYVSNGNIDNCFKLSSSGTGDKIVDLAFETLLGLKSSADVLRYSSKIVALKKDFSFFVDTLISILRDSVVINKHEIITFIDKLSDVQKISKIYSAEAVGKIVTNLCEIYNKLEFNCNLVAVVDQMLLNILEVKFLCQK